MTFRRAFASAVAFTFTATLATVSYAQDKSQEEMTLKKPEMAQYQALNALVDAVMAGKEPAPADFKLTFQNHFVKSSTGVFIPYVVEIRPGKLSSFPVAVYVRAVAKPGTAAAATTTGSQPRAAAEKKPDYAFTDVYFFTDSKRLRSTGADTTEFSRAMQLPPGDFDLYIAMSEAPPKNAKVAGPGKRVVHTQTFIVPDFSKGLTTSSIILGTGLEEAPQPLTAQQQLEEPFTIGGFRITPAFTPTFPQSAELLFAFFVYNEGLSASGKPDLDVNYYFSRAAEAKPFSKAPTTSFNATTLPPEFNLSAGHEVIVGQGIPLTSFAPGDYKVEIRVTDKTNNQTITRDVPFTVP